MGVQTRVDSIITSLAATAGQGGADKIGVRDHGNGLTAGSVKDHLTKIANYHGRQEYIDVMANQGDNIGTGDHGAGGSDWTYSRQVGSGGRAAWENTTSGTTSHELALSFSLPNGSLIKEVWIVGESQGGSFPIAAYLQEYDLIGLSLAEDFIYGKPRNWSGTLPMKITPANVTVVSSTSQYSIHLVCRTAAAGGATNGHIHSILQIYVAYERPDL
jgi:hypothetical protein